MLLISGFILLLALALSVLTFRLAVSMCWHWSVGLLLAAIPLVAVYFLGIFGLVPSAAFVSALYKFSA